MDRKSNDYRLIGSTGLNFYGDHFQVNTFGVDVFYVGQFARAKQSRLIEDGAKCFRWKFQFRRQQIHIDCRQAALSTLSLIYL